MIRITETTDGLYIGREIDPSQLPVVVLSRDVTVVFDRVDKLPDGTLRLTNSNYTIDAKEE